MSGNTLKIMGGATDLPLSLTLNQKDKINAVPDFHVTFLKLEMQHAHETRKIPMHSSVEDTRSHGAYQVDDLHCLSLSMLSGLLAFT